GGDQRGVSQLVWVIPSPGGSAARRTPTSPRRGEVGAPASSRGIRRGPTRPTSPRRGEVGPERSDGPGEGAFRPPRVSSRSHGASFLISAWLSRKFRRWSANARKLI